MINIWGYVVSLRKKILYKLSPTYRAVLALESTQRMLSSEVRRRMSVLESKYSGASENFFSGHYEYWYSKRIVAIVEKYGESWFKGKKILELGCGYGDIGRVLSSLGAEVIYVEGREEHCAVLRKRYPNNRVYQANLENEWPLPSDEKFDLILHLGLLYHMKNYSYSLEKCAEQTENLVLETEVCDTDEDFVLTIDENKDGYDQSLTGQGSRPSAKHVESILEKCGFTFDRVRDARCNANFHVYDWEVQNTKEWRSGLRRFWFCSKK